MNGKRSTKTWLEMMKITEAVLVEHNSQMLAKRLESI